MPYNEHSIRILTRQQVSDKFIWAQADALALLYPTSPRSFILKLLTAAYQVGEPTSNVIRRYLDKDRSVMISPEMYAAYSSLA